MHGVSLKRVRLTFSGSLNLRPLLRPLISAISLSLRSKLVTSKFCANLPWLLLFGITATFLCVAHRSKTCAGVFPCLSATDLMVGWSKSSGVSLALCMPSSRNDCGPNDEYAVTAMPSSCANLTSPSWLRYGWCSTCSVAGLMVA